MRLMTIMLLSLATLGACKGADPTAQCEDIYKKGDGEKAKALFAEFTPMLDFYEQMIGPYPFRDEKMGVVETPHLGMEHQTINAYGNGYRKDVYGFDWLLQHEFSHEWFGNQVTNADWDDMWLHEGFGSYMQPLYLQWLRGDRRDASRGAPAAGTTPSRTSAKRAASPVRTAAKTPAKKAPTKGTQRRAR